MQVKRGLFAEDKDGTSVFINEGDEITEIEDAGPEVSIAGTGEVDAVGRMMYEATGWNVTCRFTPAHKQWTEIVTVDAIALLKALE